MAGRGRKGSKTMFQPSTQVRTELNFNADWRFIKKDLPSASEADFNDTRWRRLDLPHDWSIEGPFSPEFASGTGFLPGGIGWYRKAFVLPDSTQDRRVAIEFDGVYKNSKVWCNGKLLGERPSGYASFSYDLTPHLNLPGMPNVMAVRVDHADYADSRWYTGSGIYRNVRLVITNPLHVKRHGVFVTTTYIANDLATVEVKTAIVNRHKVKKELALNNNIYGHDGLIASVTETGVALPPGAEICIVQNLDIPKPLLWSPATPNLYTLHTQIEADGAPRDDLCTPFGIRSLQFHPEKGFSLNGQTMKIKGLCIHHDAGALGAAVPVPVWQRRLQTFKEIGCNAIRMSHNPPAAGLLDLCDSMGFLVMDEAFDEWNGCKRKWVEGWNKGTPSLNGYGQFFEEWAEQDLSEMVLRDRNHPSVILWSIGNEVDYVNDPFPANDPSLVPIAKRLLKIVKSLDTTRPVTAALASPETNLFAECLDVVGYNYHEELYEKDHAQYPCRIIYGSENGKSLKAWQAVQNNQFIAGLHLWTGIDFLGEAAAWPSRNSQAGILDIAGFKKNTAYFWQSLWSDTPMVHLLGGAESGDGAKPHLTCYTNCETVELMQDGISLGEKRISDSPGRVLRWKVSSLKGNFTALGKMHNETVCTAEWRTPGKPQRLDLRIDRQTLKANGHDVAHVELRIVDRDGTRVDDAQHNVTCQIDGPARLIGMENGNPRSHQNYSSIQRNAFRGRLLIYVQAASKPGDVTISLTAEGLPRATVSLNVQNPVTRAAKQTAQPRQNKNQLQSEEFEHKARPW